MEFSAPREIRMSAHTSLDIFETGSMSSFVVEESPEPKERGTISTSETASRSVSLAIYAKFIRDSLFYRTVGCPGRVPS